MDYRTKPARIQKRVMTMIPRNIFVVAVWLIFPASALADHLDLAWDPNSEPDLAGYIVYYGTSPQNYTDWVDVGSATSTRITGLSEDTEYFLSLTAYDVFGNESDFSDEPFQDSSSLGGTSSVYRRT